MNFIDSDLELICHQASDSLKQLADSTIFISGATGFFGKWLLSAINFYNENSNLPINVIALSRNPSEFKRVYPKISKNHQFIAGEIESFIFPEESIDYIIHAATQASSQLNREKPSYMLHNIINGTSHIVELAKKKKVRKILHTSSGAVYGVQDPHVYRVNESYKNSPNTQDIFSAYGEGKRVSELMGAILNYETGIEFVNARCFAFCGPFLPLDSNFAVGNFIKNILNNEDIVIKSAGTSIRSYLYPTDLVVWLLRLLTHGKNLSSYNIGASDGISIKDLAVKISSYSKDSAVKILGIETNNETSSRYVPDVSSIKQELGVNESFTLDEVLEKTVRFNRSVLNL